MKSYNIFFSGKRDEINLVRCNCDTGTPFENVKIGLDNLCLSCSLLKYVYKYMHLYSSTYWFFDMIVTVDSRPILD